MVALKGRDAEAFLKSPDPRLLAVLLYGPDSGLVAERAALLARTLATRDTPPGEVITIEDEDLEADSGRLALELQTMPMFGGRKIVRARAGRRINRVLLEPLLQPGALAGALVVEAGNLRPDEGVRGLFDKAATAAAIPCYADSERDLAQLVAEMVKAAGLTIAADARELLVGRLGADRVLSRAELDKLVLYVGGSSGTDRGRREITAADVTAVVSDASDLELDRIPEAAASGDSVRAARDADRMMAAGEDAQAIVLATQRYFLRLHRLRASVEAGRSAEDVVRGLRPPLPFTAQAAMTRQVGLWSGARLTAALGEIAATVAATRQTGARADMLVERLVLRLAAMARAKG